MKLKSLLKKKKTIVILSIILIIIVIFLISLQSRSISDPITTQPTTLPQVTTVFKAPNQITWQIDHLDLSKEIDFLQTTKNDQAETILKNLAQNLGFSNQPVNIQNTPITLYSNQEESTETYLNYKEGFIKFNLNLSLKPIPQDSPKEQTLVILEKSLQLPPQVSITKSSTRYQTTDGPRFIDTTKEKADLVTTTYNYSINSFPILSSEGSSIETINSLSGKLVNLHITLPPISFKKIKNYPTKSIEEIKNTPLSQFKTIKLKGNERFTLSDQEINIDEALLNNGFLGYFQDPVSGQTEPFIFLTGFINDPQYGQIEILLGIPALSPSSYSKQ
jgi:hypothetical protein